MKDRPKYFLSDDKINHNSETFDYIVELHTYLWRFVKVSFPGASGFLSDYIDLAIEKLEAVEKYNKQTKELETRLKKTGFNQTEIHHIKKVCKDVGLIFRHDCKNCSKREEDGYGLICVLNCYEPLEGIGID